jgi:uncharacterized protein RhaS with RHS repeats
VRSYRYAADGRLEKVINSLGEEIDIGYDDANGAATVTYPNGAVVSSNYTEVNGVATWWKPMSLEARVLKLWTVT